jgi:phosphoribosyl transferase-like protein
MNSAVAFDIGVTQDGHFVDSHTGIPIPEVVEIYSRMKHGDMEAVSFFAGHVAATAMRSERFLSLMRDGVANERVVYITTAAVFTVPSASNLLLRTTAAHMNIMLTRQELPPVVLVELTRLSDSSLGYATTTVRERRDELPMGRGVTIVPESFRHQSVVFLDDLFSTGYTTSRAERRLQKVNVADRFFLFAARIDPQAVGASQGQIEDCLNNAFIDGSLASITPMLQGGNFAVVQKLVKVFLDPQHTDQFSEFLRDIPTSSLLKLYAAAASDGFRQRGQGRYLPLFLLLEAALQERGALDAEGHIMGAPVDLVGSWG